MLQGEDGLPPARGCAPTSRRDGPLFLSVSTHRQRSQAIFAPRFPPARVFHDPRRACGFSLTRARALTRTRIPESKSDEAAAGERLDVEVLVCGMSALMDIRSPAL